MGLVAAREEERRRLRRDLHDGLGPALTGIAFKADAARNTLAAEPLRAAELLAEMRADTTTAIADIRRLVYNLRPPALDDLGLVAAVREQSGRLAQRADGGVAAVSVTAPADLPPLPAAVEVAAYRIITEALTNAARHSAASRVDVALTLDGPDLLIEISDDGAADGAVPTSVGAGGGDGGGGDDAGAEADAARAAGWTPGVGLISMRDRAAELGGWCQAGPGPAGGRVTASLPVGDGAKLVVGAPAGGVPAASGELSPS
jgi:two-component system, NarL family, sensor kinase